MIGEYPERFLASDFVDSVAVAELVEWLDFANEEAKGYFWIDELRRKLGEAWYAKGWIPMMHGGSGLNKNIGVGLEKEQAMVMPSLRKLIARGSLFEGYVSQYELLVAQNMPPSGFEQKMAAIPEASTLDGYDSRASPTTTFETSPASPRTDRKNDETLFLFQSRYEHTKSINHLKGKNFSPDTL